jgi:DNA repair protein RecO (recombination protein O)
MSAIVQASGIVLHSVRHGETSLILTVFTQEHGRIGLMAKGARSKAKTGAAAGLALFTEAQFVYYHKSSRDLQLLKEWTIVSPHLGLREDFTLVTIASAVAELLSRCMRDDDPHPELYDSASETLAALDGKPASPLPLLWAFELSLFHELGFELGMAACAATGKPLIAPFKGPIRYRLADGSFFHPETTMNGYDGELAPESFAALAKLATASSAFAGRLTLNARTNQELVSFLTRYLETHLPVRGKLRSLEALHWSEGAPPTKTS